jgi:CheY-like chemotaxis protein
VPDEVIVYFEDDALSREVMKTCLTRGLGYHNVWVFEDSADFAAQLRSISSTPDVIFLDIHIEPIDGFGMLKVIRPDVAFRCTKVIAFTASVMNEEVKMLREAGFDGVIAKPLDYDTFPSVLARILQGEQVWHIK